MFAPTVPHGQFCTWKRFVFFALIDRLVCTIQSNQTLDALIKYVALRNSFKCSVEFPILIQPNRHLFSMVSFFNAHIF